MFTWITHAILFFFSFSFLHLFAVKYVCHIFLFYYLLKVLNFLLRPCKILLHLKLTDLIWPHMSWPMNFKLLFSCAILGLMEIQLSDVLCFFIFNGTFLNITNFGIKFSSIFREVVLLCFIQYFLPCSSALQVHTRMYNSTQSPVIQEDMITIMTCWHLNFLIDKFRLLRYWLSFIPNIPNIRCIPSCDPECEKKYSLHGHV